MSAAIHEVRRARIAALTEIFDRYYKAIAEVQRLRPLRYQSLLNRRVRQCRLFLTKHAGMTKT